MMTSPDKITGERGSFRDRNNQVFCVGNQILRGISEKALKDWQALERSRAYEKYMKAGNIVATKLVGEDIFQLYPDELQAWCACLEHERIPFVNYVYEWCFEMLKDAALLRLDLLDEGLHENMIIKDASVFNIQFLGAKPVFIDIPSFERYDPGTPWIGFRQFCQHFLYPLMLQA